MGENEIGTKILKSAFEVHKILGPGLLESSYQKCLVYELRKTGLSVFSELQLPLTYKDVEIESGYRLDIWVEKKVIVELKIIDEFEDIHTAQLLTYLRLTGCKLGYLFNFKTARFKNGIKRIVNGL